MANIFIITGETGPYEAWTRWNVGAFLDKNSCSDYLNKLNKFLADNNIPDSIWDFVKLDKPPSNFLDDNFEDYFRCSGVEYKMEEVEILG